MPLEYNPVTLENERHFAEERKAREDAAYAREMQMEAERRKALGISTGKEPTGGQVIEGRIEAGDYAPGAARKRLHKRARIAREVAIIRAENDAAEPVDPRSTAQKLADRAAR
jgi:hypothetical protein